MASVSVTTVMFMCVFLYPDMNDIAVSAFPLSDCWKTNIDLLLVANHVKEGYPGQMKMFAHLMDLFLGPDEVQFSRVKVSMAAYRLTSTNGFQYQLAFSYSQFENKTEIQEHFRGRSYDDLVFSPNADNSTFLNFAQSARPNTRNDSYHVTVLVSEHTQINRLFDYNLTNWTDISKVFFIIIDDSFYESPIKIDPENFVSVEKYSSLESAHSVARGLCGSCCPGWFEHVQQPRGGLLWSHSCYKLLSSKDRLSWKDALKICQKRGSTLVSIETMEELNFLRPVLNTKVVELRREFDFTALNFPVQIGLKRDLGSLGKRFRWINDAPLTITNWINPLRPNGGYVQSCGAWIFIDDDFPDGWDDFGCGYRNSHLFLCEANSLTLNPGYSRNSIVKSANAERMEAAMTRGELALCLDSSTVVSVSSVIGTHEQEKCLLFSQIGVKAVKDWSRFVSLFDCEDQQSTFIAYSFVCDHKVQCPNGRDENVCRFRKCDFLTEFTCSSKQCVPAEARCDLYKDCYDGSDEVGCTDCKHMTCQDGTCLPKHWWHDDETDCIWGDFATGYTWDLDSPSENTTSECAFLCNRTECVSKSIMNNGIVECTGPEGPLDETVGALETTNCQKDSFDLNSAMWAPKCVYYRDRFDSALGCRNMMHLRGCEDFECPDGYVKCPGSYCIPIHQAHDGKKDCPRGEDEMNEFFSKCNGNFQCMGSHICLYVDQICDGYQHCPHGDDELNCQVTCRDGFLCVGGAITVYDYDRQIPLDSLDFIDPRTRHIDLSGVILSKVFPNIPLDQSLISLNALHLSGCKIQSLDNNFLGKFESDKETQFGRDWLELSAVDTMDLSHNEIEHINEYSIIKTMFNLRILILSHNSKLKEIHIDAFQLLSFTSSIEVLDLSHTAISKTVNVFDPLVSLKFLNLSYTTLSDLKPGTFASTNNLGILDIRGTAMPNFYPDTFSNVRVSSGFYTDTYRLCCPQIRGSGIASDVCYAPADPFSTCCDLMGDEFKRVLLWVAGILAIFGNMVVIVYRIRWTRPLLRKAYGMFVVHLAASDVIMGLYLLIIAAADVYYRNVYVWQETRWRRSSLCQVAGVASLLSSEVSTCFVFMITVDRFLAVKYPFGDIRLSRKITVMICFLIWLLGVAVALIPLFPEFSNWTTYSSNGMCLGLPLVSQRFPGWQFSTAIFIGFNFFMFALILVGQVFIYHTMAAARNVHRDVCGVNYLRIQQDFAVARQLSLIAMSNFLCWFPICVMGILTMNGQEIGLAAYSWSAVLIMPINAALNPVLYTIPALHQKFSQFRRKGTLKCTTPPTQQVCFKCQTSIKSNREGDAAKT